jgi:anti-sigma factor RsiW
VTDPPREHTPYDELAAGHALHALDPQDERQFLAHLPGCPRCQATVSDFTEITAALADDWPDAGPSPQLAGPSPQLGERIMAAVTQAPAPGLAEPGPAAEQPAAEPAATVTGLAERRRRRLRTYVASVAAAAVLITGGLVWGIRSGSGGGAAGPAAGCVRAGTCHQIELTGARSHAPAAKVIVTGRTAWLIPSGLPADNTARQVYVLWQITGAHTPLPVGSFDVRGHTSGPVRIGALAVPYRGTWAFAVSLEHGRTIPATPSRPVALGQVSS